MEASRQENYTPSHLIDHRNRLVAHRAETPTAQFIRQNGTGILSVYRTMSKPFYLVTRDLHLYFGLFISPFILVFAISTFFLVHSWIPRALAPATSRTANDPLMPANLDLL